MEDKVLVGMLASEDARVQVVGGGVVVAFTAVASQLLASDGVIALTALAFFCFITLLAFSVSLLNRPVSARIRLCSSPRRYFPRL